MTDVYRWEEPFHRLPRLMMWFLALALVCAVIWAAVARVSVYALEPAPFCGPA